MSWLADARIVLHMLRGMPKSGDASERLEGFYAGQAHSYDAFRERLLHGRQVLMQQLDLPNDAYVVELGGGTGKNIEFIAHDLHRLKRYDIVDLCPSLLAVARTRTQHLNNIHVVEADACTYQSEELVDCVIFSYSLTMMPDWKAALNNAKSMLKPSGKIAIVDFTISDQQHRLLGLFWRKWFGHDGVYLNPLHLSRLHAMFPTGTVTMHFAKVPYIPCLTVPYYLFISERGH